MTQKIPSVLFRNRSSFAAVEACVEKCVILRRMAFALALFFATGTPGRALDLVRNGEACVVILIGAEPEQGPGTRYEKASIGNAARELREGVRKISGVELPLREVKPGDLDRVISEVNAERKRPFLLGNLGRRFIESAASGKADRLASIKDPSGFFITVSPEGAVIVGGGIRGTEIGVDEALEQLGIRWFFPGSLGTVIPASQNVTLPEGDLLQNPSFPARHFGFNAWDKDPATAEWKKHQREGGLFFPSAHGIRLGRGASFKEHPEFYALVHGERKDSQLCVSNPEVIRRAVESAKEFFRQNPGAECLGMGPNDGGDFCECERCHALDSGDWDSFSHEPSMTDRYLWFFNEVLKGIEKEWPRKKIAFYIYHSYMRPPVNVKPDPRIIGALAPIGLCRIHGINNPICPEKGYLKGLIADWKKVLLEVYERGYWFNLADPGMLFIQMHRLRDEIPYYAAHGCSGFRTEVTPQWAVHGPSLYIAGRLMWDANADVDAILKDYCDKLYGPAAREMIEYYHFIDSRLERGDFHTGSAFDVLKFFPKEIRHEARAILLKAQGRAVAFPFRERLEIALRGFEHMDAFARMLESRNGGDWIAAKKALEEMDAVREQLLAEEVPMLGRPQAEGYLRRFFRMPVEQGYARTQGGNKILASLPDVWETVIDPQRVGEDLHYYSESIRGGNWHPTPTFSTTWSNLGLRYYKGLAWYRQDADLPEEGAKGRVFLWFGGVDESARVWVNGKLAGTSSPSAFTPFELDVTGLVKPGKNQVTLCIANLRVDELGTGGITAPAFFYSPALGDKAVPENAKPLRRTFP